MNPLSYLPIQELRARFSGGRLTPRELANDCLKYHQKRHSLLQAYHQWDNELFGSAASDTVGEGALAGIPFSVKSVIAVDGFPCFAGTARALPQNFMREDGVVRQLKDVGGIVSGITHAAEFAVGGLGVNEHWPTPRNPWDAEHHRIPGGSSSGAAVSVWEGSCVFAVGTDTGGSVRVPASASGLAGLKTTSGRWATSGVVPLAHRFDSLGLIAHRAIDLAAIYDVLDADSICDSADRTSFHDFRVRLASDVCWEGLDPGIYEALDDAIRQLVDAGMRLETAPCTVHAEASALRNDKKPNTAAIECREMLYGQLADYRSTLGLHVREFIESEAGRPPHEVQERVDEVEAFQDRIKARQADNEITLSPTLCFTPPTLEHVKIRENYSRYSDCLLRNTVLASMARQCAVTLPVGRDAAGMPVGLQIIAPQNCDSSLLRFAIKAESVLGCAIDRLGIPPLLGQNT